MSRLTQAEGGDSTDIGAEERLVYSLDLTFTNEVNRVCNFEAAQSPDKAE